jgi:transposase
MKPYSQDLRERVLRAVESGMPRADIVKTFAVSLATLKRYLKQRRETGHLQPKPIPGRPSRKGAALQAGLLPQLQAHEDARLADHCQQWEAEQGVQVSTATMSRAIRRLGWTRKKSRWQPANAGRRNGPAGVSR